MEAERAEGGKGRAVSTVMRLPEHVILNHDRCPAACFSQQKPDTGVFFSNSSSNVIHHFTYLLRGFSSFITYLLSFFVPVPVSVIGYWCYKNKRIHVLKDSPVLGQADMGQSILISLHWLVAII